jgi:hypothetical protein
MVWISIICVHFIDLIFIRPTKLGREKSPSDRHCKCEKEMDDHILACQQILVIEPHSDTLAKERALFLNINDINDILYFWNA